MSNENIDTGSKDVSAAKKRWRLLARSLIKPRGPNDLQSTEVVHDNISIRRFKGFGIFIYERKNEDENGIWYGVKSSKMNRNGDIRIRLLHAKLDPDTLIGFNNTGNICIWPSEEILAVYCLKNKEQFCGKNVCELGGGMAALAGLLLATAMDADEILLTDGNQESSSNIHQILKENQNYFETRYVHSRTLLWGQDEPVVECKKYDFIICADCFFFIEYQEALAATVQMFLHDKGKAIFFAPKRGKTFDQFRDLAEKSFDVVVSENYDEEIWLKHQEYKRSEPAYDPDIHYPLKMVLCKKGIEP